MWSDPVTLGGGMTIVHGVASGRSGRNSPRLSQCAYQRSSMLLGSKVLGSSAMEAAVSGPSDHTQPHILPAISWGGGGEADVGVLFQRRTPPPPLVRRPPPANAGAEGSR